MAHCPRNVELGDRPQFRATEHDNAKWQQIQQDDICMVAREEGDETAQQYEQDASTRASTLPSWSCMQCDGEGVEGDDGHRGQKKLHRQVGLHLHPGYSERLNLMLILKP